MSLSATYYDELVWDSGLFVQRTTVLLEDFETGEPLLVMPTVTLIVLDSSEIPPEDGSEDADLRDLGWQ